MRQQEWQPKTVGGIVHLAEVPYPLLDTEPMTAQPLDDKRSVGTSREVENFEGHALQVWILIQQVVECLVDESIQIRLHRCPPPCPENGIGRRHPRKSRRARLGFPVVGDRVAADEGPPTQLGGAEAVIDILVVVEEGLVERADLIQGLSRHRRRGTGRHLHLTGSIREWVTAWHFAVKEWLGGISQGHANVLDQAGGRENKLGSNDPHIVLARNQTGHRVKARGLSTKSVFRAKTT